MEPMFMFQKKEKKTEKKIKFKYVAPFAQSIFVAGTFNDWNPTSCPLRKNGFGEWNTSLTLPPGRHEYRFIVDGVWECDQEPVECIPNAFGTWNSVVQVTG